MKRFYTLSFVFLTLISCLFAYAQDKGEAQVIPDVSTWMSDANLRDAVRSELNIANGETLTQADMLDLTQLTARNASISNLTGLEHATNLTKLDLRRNNISSITALENLTNLTDLWLAYNSITDISPLSDLTNLTFLSMRNNQVVDITSLGSLTNLTNLWIKSCGITDVSPLETLVNLRQLRIQGNALTNAYLLGDLENLTDVDITIPDPPQLDTTAPEVNIAVPSGTQNGAFEVTITFTESVSGFTQTGLGISGNATITLWSVNLNNTIYTATINPTGSGQITFNVRANVATDGTGNPNTPAAEQTVTADVDRPAVTISAPSDTQNGAFDATITFSEAVSDFVQTDISLSGTASASITGWTTTDDTVYTATIIPTTSGTVTLNIDADVATDAANNQNTAATQQTVTVDVDRPTVTITVPSGIQNGAFDTTITFSETVLDFAQTDVNLSGTATASITTWEETTEDTVYTATITPTTSGTVILNVDADVATDAGENGNTAATQQTVTVDVDRPTVTITVPSGIQNGAFDITITFSEAVSDFVQTDVSLSGTMTTASITNWEETTTDTVYTATITPTNTPTSLSGTVILNVNADVATDAAGNGNTAATQKTVTVDIALPVVSLVVKRNNAPVFTNGTSTTRSIEENTVRDTNIGTPVAATDADEDTLTYTLSGTDAASFSIISTSGQLRTKAALNYEVKNSYSVTITVSDGNGGSDSITVTINITDQDPASNNAPVFDEGDSTTRSVDKGTSPSQMSATDADDDPFKHIYPSQNLGLDDPVSATDADGDPLTYALSGTDEALFSIDRTTGQLSNKDYLNYTDKTSYSVTITVSDSKEGTDTITVTITDDKSPVARITPFIRKDKPPWVLELDSETGIVSAIIPETYTRYTAFSRDEVSFTRPVGVKFENSFEVAIAFDEQVSGLEQTDLTLTDNTAGASIINWRIQEGWSAYNKVIRYRAKVEVTQNGSVTFNVAADVASDSAGNSNAAPESKTVTATITLTNYPPWDVNENGSIDATDSGLVTAAIGQSGDGIVNTRTDVNWDGTVDADDLALVTYHIPDTTAPSVSISVPSGNQNGAFDATITFSEAVSDFVQGDVSLSGTATASITAWVETTTDTVFTATITPTSSGTVVLDIAADVATDAAKNGNADATQQTVTVDVDKPTVTIGVPSGTQNGAFDATITFTESVSDFEQTDLVLSGTATASITAWTTTDNTVYTAEITPTTSGTVTLSIAAGVATDAASNSNTAATSQTVNMEMYLAWDVNEDGSVDITDVVLVANALGQSGPGITNERTDVNGDGTVDSTDLVLVSDNLDSSNVAPVASRNIIDFLIDPAALETLDRDVLQTHLEILRAKSDGSLKYLRAITLLESILAALRPDETRLLANYPNPFNPETWIPYQLPDASDVQITIYDVHGSVVRLLDLGHQPAGYYTNRSHAAHWNGRNAVGEKVASGIYFYQLQADNMSLLRKMVILK